MTNTPLILIIVDMTAAQILCRAFKVCRSCNAGCGSVISSACGMKGNVRLAKVRKEVTRETQIRDSMWQ
jgi:hypothetical protein